MERHEPDPPEGHAGNLWSPHDRRALRRALDGLSRADRAIVEMRVAEGRSSRDAGRALDVSEGTARVRLHRAKARLRVRYVLARRGEEASATCLRVLDALAARDRAAQARLGIDDHLRMCVLCGLALDDLRAPSLDASIFGSRAD